MTPHTWATFFAASGRISRSPGAGVMAGLTAGQQPCRRAAAGTIVGWRRGVAAIRGVVAVGPGALLRMAFGRSN